MDKLLTSIILVFSAFLFIGCENDKSATLHEKDPSIPQWWTNVKPIVIGDSEFYGSTCSVVQVKRDQTGIKSVNVIFTAPVRLFTYCFKSEYGKNYLEFDGEYIILNVVRQTTGAGASTGERYRSANFSVWEEYIGVTWIKGEEYEAWRKLGSHSTKADSRKKVIKK
ncbi:hypothetical protein ACOYR1_09575 [Thalassotalea piscium]